jgi:hypothetical protein
MNYPSSILCTKLLNFNLTYSRLNIFLNLFKKILTTDNDKFSTFIGKGLKAAYGCLSQIKIMEDIMTCFFLSSPIVPI